MACTIDHLRVDHKNHVIQGFTDPRGAAHFVGEAGLLLELTARFATGEISLVWNRDGKQETMVFSLNSRTGPGNGRMKQFFELGEEVDPGRQGMRFIPNCGYVPSTPPKLPPDTGEFIRSGARFEAAIQRVWALAGRKRFEEANEQLLVVLRGPDRRVDATYDCAKAICACALAHAFDPDPTVYHWLRERGVGLWYSWGAGASAGGEGAVRSVEIRAAEADFEKIEQARSMGVNPGEQKADIPAAPLP